MKKQEILVVLCGFVFLFVILPCLLLGMGIYDLVIAFPSRNTHIGTVTGVHKREHCSNDDGCSWTVIEVFQKANSTRTCETESEFYEHESQANHVVKKTVLGTHRRIWEFPNDALHCYDERIRKSYLPPSIVWFLITGFVILFLFYLLCGKQRSPERDYEAICENAFTANPLTNDLARNGGRTDDYKAIPVFDIESETVAL
jgi:hypothetical protein